MNVKKLSIIVVLPVLLLLSAVLWWGLSSEEHTDIPEETVNERESNENNNEIDSGNEQTDERDREEQINEGDGPILYDGEFELPIEGAAGYSSIAQKMHTHPYDEAPIQTILAPGTAFEILSEDGNWWEVQTTDTTGWIEHQYAFINLPDVIPSIIYDNTNSYASVFTSSAHDIPELTNEALYSAIDYNERLEEETFIMPILYATAKKVNAAQQLALENGEALKIYETFRPFETQNLIGRSLMALAEENEEVEEGLNREPWTPAWFIIIGNVSNHQIGAAMDVSLVNVEAMDEEVIGDYMVLKVTDYTELEMQTTMHELSADSVIFEQAIPSNSQTEWLSQQLVETVTEPSIRLQQYAAEAGFIPIASEWWHFNDLEAVESLGESTGTGDFLITQTLNSKPVID